MKKRNLFFKRYWWLLAMLLLASYFAFLKPKNSSLSSRETKFAIPDTGSVTRVELATITLDRAPVGWLLNGAHPANHQSVQVLLTALYGMRIVSPAPYAVSDSLRADLLSQGHMVTVFAGKRKIKQYRLGYTITRELGAVGLLQGAKTVYQIEAPHVGGELLNIFSRERAYWLSSRVRFPNLESLVAIEMEMPGHPQSSFRINLHDPRSPSLQTLHQNQILSSFDTLNLYSYLRVISNFTIDAAPVNLAPDAATQIHLAQPDFIITHHRLDGTITKYSLMPIPVADYMDEMGRSIRFDLNRMYLITSADPTIFDVKFIPFAPILRDISFFKPKFKR